MKYYKPKEVCEIFSISRRTFYDWEKTGKIHVELINGQKRVSQKEVDRVAGVK